MAYPERNWWIDVDWKALWFDKAWMLCLKLDYDSLNMSVMLGWFGFRVFYLTPMFSDVMIASGAYFHWKPRTIREIISGDPVFHKNRGFHSSKGSQWY